MTNKIRITSALNYESYTAMSDDQLRQFIQNHVHDTLIRSTRSDRHPAELLPTNQTPYKVQCRYTIIDTQYNHRGHITATMTYQQQGYNQATFTQLRIKKE